ncbi:MAG: hypothetical protein SGJ23_04370 [Alphaproteobacteria bacterium]|nr:hypothetical protein [Alphaproteobacteria bacterium]
MSAAPVEPDAHSGRVHSIKPRGAKARYITVGEWMTVHSIYPVGLIYIVTCFAIYRREPRRSPPS